MKVKMPAAKGNKYALGNKGNTAKAITISVELFKDICEQVAKGKNIKAVLNSNANYPKWDTFRKAKNESEEFNALYVKALQDKGEMEVCEIDEVCEDLVKGKIDASTANVIIQAKKWKASKFYPKMYGEKTEVANTNYNYNSEPLTPEKIKELNNVLENDY